MTRFQGSHRGSRTIDFFIVGVQKGGTTALDAYLRLSRHIQMSKDKEVHFFDNETIDWACPQYQMLHDHFSWPAASLKCRGEATPVYIYWPNALERLQRYNPRAKLIVCLRQPAFRAYSHWRMEMKRGYEALPFEEAISDVGRRRLKESSNGAHLVFSYVERGFYAQQISRMKRLFPSEQLLFLRTDLIWNDPMRQLGRVHSFLGVPAPESVVRDYVVPIDGRSLGCIPKQELKTLNTLYASDIKQLSRLIGMDLDDWLSPDYRDIGE
jgi:hypothetical protein